MNLAKLAQGRAEPEILAWAKARGIPGAEALLKQLWRPLAEELVVQRQRLGRPLIQGLLGMQGAGKTTLGEVLTLLLGQMGYRCLGFSIDDLYKTDRERQALMQQDPRLIWRGPPGTHDLDLGLGVLAALRRGGVVEIPQFDKALGEGRGDRIAPKIVQDIDIVLFEGWFLGMQPLAPQHFDGLDGGDYGNALPLPAPLVTAADRAFARDCNARLGDYLPLWDQLDGLMVLALSDYRLSKTWRLAAERRLRAQGRGGMGDRELEAFVDYFWKALHPALFIPPLIQPGGQADLVAEIGQDHGLVRLYRP